MALKVLHCIYALHGGGAERQLTILANNLDNSGLAFGVFCVDASINDIQGVNSQILTISDKKNYPWKMVKEIGLAIKEYNPDIVHCWLPPSISAPALIAAKLHGKPAVASYRNKKIIESWIRIPEIVSTLFCANAIVANNPPEQSSWVFRALYQSKIHAVIPNAINVPAIYCKNLSEEIIKDNFSFLFVGRLTHQKNWQVLLSALSNISANKAWNLTICGKGEDEGELIKMAERLGIRDRINLLGYRKDVYDIMHKADLLILPSWYEGMPNVVLEAMYIGLPCVVSKITAHTSLFDEDSGVKLFEPEDDNELADLLSDILSKKINIYEMAIKAKEFSGQFSPEKLLLKYHDFYHGLV